MDRHLNQAEFDAFMEPIMREVMGQIGPPNDPDDIKQRLVELYGETVMDAIEHLLKSKHELDYHKLVSEGVLEDLRRAHRCIVKARSITDWPTRY